MQLKVMEVSRSRSRPHPNSHDSFLVEVCGETLT